MAKAVCFTAFAARARERPFHQFAILPWEVVPPIYLPSKPDRIERPRGDTTMSKRYFRYHSLEELREEAEKLGLDIPFETELEAVWRPVQIGPLRAGNSLAIHPMEGCDGTLDGRPDELTFRRWERFGGGGAKLIWGEATAVVREGRANPRQLWLNDRTLPAFQRLVQRTRSVHRKTLGRDDDLVIGLQLTHSGRWSHERPIIAVHNPPVDARTFLDKKKTVAIPDDYPVVEDSYLEDLEDRFVDAAKLAYRAGFDFVDIKQCHTYLLCELLGARSREGKYGGSWENRTRFIRNVVAKIKEAVPGLVVATRINCFDGIPFCFDPELGRGRPVEHPIPYLDGFGLNPHNPLEMDLTEPKDLVRLLASLGVPLVNVSMGSPYFNPHYGRPLEKPPIDAYDPPEHPLIGVDRHFRAAEEIQRACPEVVIVGTGYSWLRHYLLNAAEGNLRHGRVRIVGAGRGAIAYPDFVRDAMRTGRMDPKKSCLAVSFCTTLMRSKEHELGQYPTGCVPRDPVYADIFGELKRQRKEAKRR
jgi:2,4-dienoyl-CoA reductase-like NADH-dependent reductase (Old Yellow Enzyme family)